MDDFDNAGDQFLMDDPEFNGYISEVGFLPDSITLNV